MQPVHANFRLFFKLSDRLHLRICYLSASTPPRDKWVRWIPGAPLRHLIKQVWAAHDVRMELLRFRSPDLIWIFEHKPVFSFWLYALCFFKRAPVCFIVNHLQQAANRSVFHRSAFWWVKFLVRRFAFWPVHLEIKDEMLAPAFRFHKSIVVSHPIPAFKPVTREPGGPLKIGVIGNVRPEKDVDILLDRLIRFVERRKELELVVGAPKQGFRDLAARYPDLAVVDTSEPEDYETALQRLDLLVTMHEEQAYYYRPSGIINDALTAGCVVVAPNLPIFRAQIHTPTQVGETYDAPEELEEALERAIALVHSGDADFEAWRSFRSDERILETLSEALKRVRAPS